MAPGKGTFPVTATQVIAFTMPESDELFGAPPYFYDRVQRVSAICRCDGARLARLVPAPLECVGDTFELFFLDALEVRGLRPYREAGIAVPVTFNGRAGGHVALEYVSSDDSLCAGREIWGYPKKLAHVDIRVKLGQAECVLARDSGEIARLTVVEDSRAESRSLGLQPRFQVRVVPSPTGGPPHRQVVMNLLGSSHTDSVTAGRAVLTTRTEGGEMLSQIGPIEPLCGEITTGGFVLDFASEVQDA